jgi:hypothetical protein
MHKVLHRIISVVRILTLDYQQLFDLSVSIMSVGPVCPGIEHPSGAYDRLFITLRQLRFCFCGAPALTRGRVCLLCMLLVLGSADLLGSQSLWSRDHILLSQSWDFPLRRLLRIAGVTISGQRFDLCKRIRVGRGTIVDIYLKCGTNVMRKAEVSQGHSLSATISLSICKSNRSRTNKIAIYWQQRHTNTKSNGTLLENHL